MKYNYIPKQIHTTGKISDEIIKKITNYKFHPSTVASLLVDPRKKDTEELSETAKTYCEEIFVEIVSGRKKQISNKFMDKGNANEPIGISMATNFYNEGFIDPDKKIKYSNDYLEGTPDIVLKDRIVDTKGSWDIFTFKSADGNNDTYYVQLQCYMDLTGKKEADLFYYLSDTPDFIIQNERNRMFYKFEDGDSNEEFKLWETNYLKLAIYSDLLEEQRFKVFRYNYDVELIKELKERIIKARNYMLTLNL